MLPFINQLLKWPQRRDQNNVLKVTESVVQLNLAKQNFILDQLLSSQ